ncbi:tetratricopeptide repeat protein [Brevundimonas basaltis]|uniref:Tetratricopeptide (TPR) repeat protein n=1 Tax=Brevundimonas basaltis TaxID=472166 RepID=A0A7W8MGZ0_9CAUL|nr:tetratricopeptide repeat protein [Brevundimonas basaltis]MBB5292169.1 tetratricopeptide (TPR) repeat protein [Brevundimonas basaltis]
MRLSSLRLLLSGCAVLAFAAPAAAQDAPIVIDPPLRDGLPVVVPVPGLDAIPPEDLMPPAVVSTEDPAPVAEAAAPPIPEVWSPAPFTADGQSAYGLYLSGRVASLRGQQAVGAELLARSQALTPEQPQLGGEAFLASLFSGDLDAVVRLAPFVAETPLFAGAGRLAMVVQNLRDGDGRAALSLLRAESFSDPYGPVSSYLAPAVAAAGGDWDAALQPVEAPVTQTAGLILRAQRAQFLEARDRSAEADAEYQAVLASNDGARLFRLQYGAFLERQGRRDEALEVYAAALAGEAPDPRALAAIRRLRAGGRAPAAPTIRQIAADALSFAAMETSQVDIHQLSAIYLHLAAALHPDDTILLRLAESLDESHEDNAARAAFARVSTANPIVYAAAQLGLGVNLVSEERDQEALEAFIRADAAAPNEGVVAGLLARQYSNLGRFGEALAVLNRPNVNTADQSAELRFERGRALEQLGRIEEAEAELWAALQMAPDSPQLLNHLGYLWVDSGRRVEQGAEMIARAFAADPRDANIQDSLGWAQYRRGQYESAVETLEEAVAKQPANAEINDHLGDAYWRVGRLREAGWQWNRVLTLEPEPDRRAEVEQKLTRGLLAPPVTGSQP